MLETGDIAPDFELPDEDVHRLPRAVGRVYGDRETTISASAVMPIFMSEVGLLIETSTTYSFTVVDKKEAGSGLEFICLTVP